VLIGLDVDQGEQLWVRSLEDESGLVVPGVAPWRTLDGLPGAVGGEVAVIPTGRPGRDDDAAADRPAEMLRHLGKGPVIAVDLRTGEERWRTPAVRPVGHAVDDDLAVITVTGEPGSDVAVRDVETGALRWRVTSAQVSQGVAVADDAVYIATAGDIVVHDRDSGRERGQLSSPGPAFTMREMGGILLVDTREELAAVDISAGALRWRAPSPGGAPRSSMDGSSPPHPRASSRAISPPG
jgi:outer membrane protein assembly factor BamB